MGASHKGRVWSMSSSSIPDWRQWCVHIARRILNESIPTNDFLRHTLIPSEIDALPQKEFFAAVLPTECYGAEAQDFRLFSDGKEINFHDFAILGHDKISDTEVHVRIGFAGTQNALFDCDGDHRKGILTLPRPLETILKFRKERSERRLVSSSVKTHRRFSRPKVRGSWRIIFRGEERTPLRLFTVSNSCWALGRDRHHP